jgi:hypothetical protein
MKASRSSILFKKVAIKKHVGPATFFSLKKEPPFRLTDKRRRASKPNSYSFRIDTLRDKKIDTLLNQILQCGEATRGWKICLLAASISKFSDHLWTAAGSPAWRRPASLPAAHGVARQIPAHTRYSYSPLPLPALAASSN